MGCKKTKVFLQPSVYEDRKKMKNGQDEQNQGFDLILSARRRTKVRRAASLVRSIKHKIKLNEIKTCGYNNSLSLQYR